MTDSIHKLFDLLGSRRGRWLTLAIVAAGVSVLDAVAAVLVFTLFQTLTSPGDDLNLPVIGDIGRFAPGLDTSGLLLIGGLVIAVVFVTRSVAYITQTYFQQRVANNAAVEISDRLLRGYLAMPYTFHLHHNSAELIRNAYDAVNRLTNEVLAPTTRVVSEGFIILAMLAVLVISAPAATGLAVGVFGPTVFLLLRVVHPRLKRLGRISQEMARESLQSLQQALSGLRDIKLLGQERFFARRFRAQRRRFAHARYLRATANELPRVTIETVLVLTVAVFLAVTILTGRSPGDAFAVLGLMGYAAFRILPSLTKLLSQLNNLKFARPTIDDVHADLVFLEEHAPETPRNLVQPLPMRRAIGVKEVHYRYEGTTVDALDGIDLEIPCGTALGIVGPTGGGKTTLVDVLCGLLEPTSGRVAVDGVDIRKDLPGWQRNLGVVHQSIFLLDDTLRRNIAFGLPDEEIDEEQIREAVCLAQLDEFVESLPVGLDTVVGERGVRISGGQRQRVAIARALYRQPEVLVFDEATSALDSATERRFMASLAERLSGRTLIMVAHRITTVRDCDRIVLVSRGRITDSGTYSELLERSPAFRELATGTR